MSAFTNFFVRIKADTNLPVFDLRMFFQVNNSRYYFGDPSFIICTQQCFSVGNNQVLSFMIKQFGKLNGRKNYIIFGTKHDIRTIVLFYNTRSHIFTTHIRTCIHVGNKSDCGYILIYIGRKRGKKIAMLVQSNILQA